MKKFLFAILFIFLLRSFYCTITTSFDKYYPSSCNDPSIIEDGEYQIYPDGLVPVQVYCDVSKGGWTIILNKVEKSDFFNRSWTDYLYGFGLPRENYWAGLVNVRNLVLTEPMILRVELSNSEEDEFFIEYESFYVGSEETEFVLHVGNRTRGNLMDTFSTMSRAKFFTHDRFYQTGRLIKTELAANQSSMDQGFNSSRHMHFKGAWWYHHDGSHSVCLTCNPRTPFEGNWQQHSNLLTFSNSKMMLKPRNDFRPSNCYEIFKIGGIKQDGIYNIYLSDSKEPTRVYCEMKKGGWTRILNRVDRLTPTFDRLWNDYKDGFGDLVENHWIGLRAMQLLTYHEQMMLRIEVESESKRDPDFIEYPSFLIYPESQRFKIQLNASSRGTLYDWMATFHNGMIFYTKDVDSTTNCATDNLGGWWFNTATCYRACLTCAKLTHGQYSVAGSDPSNPSSRKSYMKMLIKPFFDN